MITQNYEKEIQNILIELTDKIGYDNKPEQVEAYKKAEKDFIYLIVSKIEQVRKEIIKELNENVPEDCDCPVCKIISAEANGTKLPL